MMNITFNKDDTTTSIEEKILKVKCFLSSKTDGRTIHKMYNLCVSLNICLNKILFDTSEDILFYEQSLTRVIDELSKLFSVNITLEL